MKKDSLIVLTAKRMGLTKDSRLVKFVKKMMRIMQYIRQILKAGVRAIKALLIGVPKQSDVPIEVCLLTIDKDFHMLKNCLDGIRKHVKHPITKISIVSRPNEWLSDFCRENGCVFVDETSVLGYGPEKLASPDKENTKGREGFLFQQLLKLGFDKICEQEHYIVVDTDTVFLKPRLYKFNEITIFEYTDERHIPIQNAYKKLMGVPFSFKKSFVAHTMLFEKSMLSEMKSFIEDKHKISWDDAIIFTGDYSSGSPFSEFEIYGNFFMRFHRANMKVFYWLNITGLTYDKTKRYPFWAKSLSCHAYLRKTPIIESQSSRIGQLSVLMDIITQKNPANEPETSSGDRGGVRAIFEFGSRYGEDTCEFAKKYPNATVYGFECNPETLPLCRKAVEGFSNIVLTEKAVSNEIGTVKFYPMDKEKTETTWEDGNQGASSLLKASDNYKVEKYVQKEVTVESTTLDAFVTEHKISQVDLLWMDVQGAELFALEGFGEKIKMVKLMHIEVNFIEIYSGQPLYEDIRSFMEKKNFTFMGFTSKGDYFSDAIFINNDVMDSLNKTEIKLLRKAMKGFCV